MEIDNLESSYTQAVVHVIYFFMLNSQLIGNLAPTWNNNSVGIHNLANWAFLYSFKDAQYLAAKVGSFASLAWMVIAFKPFSLFDYILTQITQKFHMIFLVIWRSLYSEDLAIDSEDHLIVPFIGIWFCIFCESVGELAKLQARS